MPSFGVSTSLSAWRRCGAMARRRKHSRGYDAVPCPSRGSHPLSPPCPCAHGPCAPPPICGFSFYLRKTNRRPLVHLLCFSIVLVLSFFFNFTLVGAAPDPPARHAAGFFPSQKAKAPAIIVSNRAHRGRRRPTEKTGTHDSLCARFLCTFSSLCTRAVCLLLDTPVSRALFAALFPRVRRACCAQSLRPKKKETKESRRLMPVYLVECAGRGACMRVAPFLPHAGSKGVRALANSESTRSRDVNARTT